MPDPVLLYLVRHAIAEERGPAFPDDSRRPLTPEGIERFERCVAGLAAAGVEIDEILTSPFVRARQTAEVLAAGLPTRPSVSPLPALAAGGPVTAVLDAVARAARTRRIALVGHEPWMGALAARLIGSRHPLPFKKGAVACVELDEWPPGRPGRLAWFMPPRLLRRLGGAR